MSNSYTERVIHWLDDQDYSKKHWQTIATECYEKTEKNQDQAIELLAEHLKNFHKKYQTSVVKPNNILFDFIDLGLNEVDWIEVAKSRYNET